MFLFHRLSFYLLEKKKKKWGHRASYLSGGPNLTPPPQTSMIIQNKTLRGDFFCHLYITHYMHEVAQHYDAKKEEKENKV